MKRHHIPGVEDGYRIGDATLLVPGTTPTSGVAICKDFDFPALGREYAARGAAKTGLLTVRDDRGRLLAETRSDAAPLALLVATVPVRQDATVAARYGNWFGWLCVIATVALLARLRRMAWTKAGSP